MKANYLGVTLLTMFLLTGLAAAQETPKCGERDEIVKLLLTQYRESPRAIGLVSPEALVEVFTSTAGTFTILLTAPEGKSCIISVGEDWAESRIEDGVSG